MEGEAAAAGGSSSLVFRGCHLPPGFRFQPTDQEIIVCYQKKEIAGTATSVPTTDDDDDDNLSHQLNHLVKSVTERETRPVAASMTMPELIRWNRLSNNHRAVAVLGNVQLEHKHLGRLILYDAHIYVKPQFVDVSESSPHELSEEEDERERRQDTLRTRQTEKLFLNVQADQLRQADAFPTQEVEISAEDGGKQEVESIERASKTDETMAFQSPQPLIPQVWFSGIAIAAIVTCTALQQ